ncbi:DUF7288 family protein [Halomarina pelagica]|uniref:DUF7288 family protein n=1 Tax=Halomarina pelagica TaxID=2961599 RepID=UPI0020C1BD99|nr:hypothetical protein [Halomarina sp. BND7]
MVTGRRGDRGQVHTLEAVVAGVVVVAGLVYALQVTAVTPLSASTSSQHIENQQTAVVEGVLAASVADGSLERTLLAWDDANERFYGTAGDRAYFVTDLPDTAFGDRLYRTFEARGVAVNVVVRYRTPSGSGTQRVIYRGKPSDNAVTVVRPLTLFDGDELRFENGTATGTTVSGATPFYVEAAVADGSSVAYKVVTVEVTVWRM